MRARAGTGSLPVPARRDGAAGDYDGLRQNRGGAPNGVTFWLSYLFPDETHLNDIYHGPSGRTRQFWTLAHPTMEIPCRWPGRSTR